MSRSLRIPIFTIVLMLFAQFSTANNLRSLDQQHTEVSLRMIGHELLLAAGDSTSRVLPIQQEGEQYRIGFSEELEFFPDDAVAIISKVMKQTALGDAYIVEVQECESGEVVYSYEMAELPEEILMPCKGRALPMGCYELVLTINTPPVTPKPMQMEEGSSNRWMWLLGALIVMSVILIRRILLQRGNKGGDLIALGDYQFDSVRAVLANGRDQIELTSKESDLLHLLYQSTNETVERDVILQRVWGDNGDYVGRTLDVFISKLRKKLEGNPRVKIVNVRGVGYKMVIS